MDTYIWQLVIWVAVFFFGTPLSGLIVGGLGILVAAITDKEWVAPLGIVLGWVASGTVAVIAFFNGIRSIIELVQYASAG